MKSQLKTLIKACHEWVELNGEVSMTKIGEKYGVCRKSIAKLAKNSQDYLLYTVENKNDPDDSRIYYFTENELRIVERCSTENDKTMAQIAKEEKVGKTETIRRWMEILGAEPSAPTFIHKYDDINEDIFKDIDTEEKAYWLGFILADGCMIDRTGTGQGYVFSISLGEKDRGHLVKFAQFVGVPEIYMNDFIKNDIGGAYDRSNTVCRVGLGRKKFCKNLIEKGIIPNKSCKETVYKDIPKNLEKHFLRGLIDGDGSIAKGEKGLPS